MWSSCTEFCCLNFCHIYLTLCWCCYINLLTPSHSINRVVEPSTFFTPDSFLECISYFPTCVHSFVVICKKKKTESKGRIDFIFDLNIRTEVFHSLCISTNVIAAKADGEI